MSGKLLEHSTTITVILAVLLIVASILTLKYAFRSTMDGYEWETTFYRVQTGDSLWSISADYCPDGVDRREWIEEVRELNGMDNSIIYPGQKLTVLAPIK